MSLLQSLIEHYGYVAVFVGCFFEGETVLVLAGFAAHSGYLLLPEVVVTAAIAGFAGDQTWYLLGRRYGEHAFDRFPRLRRAEHRIKALVAKYGAYAAFGIRFLVGFRIAGPIAMGASRMPELKFAPANAAGAIVWATLFAAAGYIFGEAFTRVLEHAKHFEEVAFAVLAVAGVVTLSVLRRRAKRAD
ncbi:MAG: DedA family protein [Proteobacteria bacterium]|nr:DedA family protein [Pseudomonadota bacterium]